MFRKKRHRKLSGDSCCDRGSGHCSRGSSRNLKETQKKQLAESEEEELLDELERSSEDEHQ